jgi:hypothetical protein
MAKLSQFPMAITFIALIIFAVFSSNNLYSQTLDSPPYGISVEKWNQLQETVNSKRIHNPEFRGGGTITNGSFESGDFTGWITQDLTILFFPLQVGTSGVDVGFDFFVSSPTEGSFAALHGWDGSAGIISIAQDVTLPADAQTLEFDYRAAWNLELGYATLDRIFSVKIEPSGGGAPLQTSDALIAVAPTINNDTGNLHGSIDISAFADSSIRISFEWSVPEDFSGPAFFQLDNVFVIPVDAGPQITVSPANIDFGNVEAGTSSSPHSVTIRSVGSENLTVSGISDPGSPFSLSSLPTLPVVIPPGGTETFEVTFSPLTAGVFNSTITVTSDDPSDPTKDVTLTGEGVVINPAMPGVCYASTGINDGGRLLTIDNNTGAGTLIGPTGLELVPGLAIDSKGIMYGSDGRNLYKIDAVTGAAVFVANTGLQFLPAIAFDGNDVLYGLGLDPVNFQFSLFTINTTTGVPTVVGPAPMGNWRGMAFDPTDGSLWGSTSEEEIFIINPHTGETTLMGTTGLGAGTPDIHFDDMGNLYGSVGGGGSPNNLISINKTTGAGTVIGPIGFTSVSGLASRQQPLVGSQIGVIPPIVDFGRTEVGTTSLQRTVAIRSVGSSNLTVSGISDPSSLFSLINVPSLPVIIPPLGTETFEVNFSPTSAGVFNSSITITSDDPSDPTKDVSLTGEGVVINPAKPGVCYASTGINDGGNLLAINNTTGTGTLIGPTGLELVPGLAIDSNGDMYGIDGNTSDLYKIDAATGTAVFVASTGLIHLPAIAFDGNDVLHGLGVDPVNIQFSLLTINTTTGVPTLVGPVPTYDWRGLAFDPTDGKLWASTNGEEIYVINPITGSRTLIGATGLGAGTPDIHFDDMGNLYGSIGGGGSPNNLISINKTTGAGTVIGPIGFIAVSGMAARLNRVVSVGNDTDSKVPTSFALVQNYPNPFNPTTTISYSIPREELVQLKLYNTLGEEVLILINEVKQAGNYKYKLDATSLTSGIYFYRLQAGSFVETRKMVLMK